MILTNTPEGPVSEGLARYGTRFAAPLDERADLLVEIFERAGLPIAADPAAARETRRADRSPRWAARHGWTRRPMKPRFDGTSTARRREEVLAYLRDVGRYRPKVAEKRLEFIEDPLSRLYVFAYEGGEALVAAMGRDSRSARPGRALRPPPPRAGHTGSTPRGAGLSVTAEPSLPWCSPGEPAMAKPAAAPASTATG